MPTIWVVFGIFQNDQNAKFKKNPDWDSEEFRLLTEDLLGLLADAKVNAIDISGLSVFEVELLQEMDNSKKVKGF